jgi:ATP-dependent Lon protease
VILPDKNKPDLMEDLPKELREEMEFVFAKDIRDVLGAALEADNEANHESKNGTNGHAPRTRKRKSEKEKEKEKEKAEAKV